MSLIFDASIIYLIISHYLASSVYGSDIIMLNKMAAPILIFLIWVVSKMPVRNIIETLKTYNNISLLFCIYFISTGLSLVMSDNILFSISRIIGLIFLFLISFYIIPSHINTKEKYLRYLEIVNWTLLVLLVIGIILSLGNPAQSITNYGGRLRYTSILRNANTLGFYTMLGYITSIMLMHFKKRKLSYLISVIINLAVLISTDSRTSIMCTIFFTVLISMFYLYEKNRGLRVLIDNFYGEIKSLKSSTKVLILILILVILSVGLISAYKLDKITREGINILLSGRLNTWFGPFSEINNINTILFGTGGSNNYENPHNYLISVILDWGVISAVVFLTIMLYTAILLINIIVGFKQVNYISKLAKFNLSIYLTVLIFSNFEAVLFNIGNLLSIFVWSNLGILINKFEAKTLDKQV